MSTGIDIGAGRRSPASGDDGPQRPRVDSAAEAALRPNRVDAAGRQKSLTIGAVCKQLEREFPDISISKIRYLEDQKLLSPRRTQGGYRLYTATDVQRLRTILRLQRDEFLPLRVIRQELAAGRSERDVAAAPGGGLRQRPRFSHHHLRGPLIPRAWRQAADA